MACANLDRESTFLGQQQPELAGNGILEEACTSRVKLWWPSLTSAKCGIDFRHLHFQMCELVTVLAALLLHTELMAAIHQHPHTHVPNAIKRKVTCLPPPEALTIPA